MSSIDGSSPEPAPTDGAASPNEIAFSLTSNSDIGHRIFESVHFFRSVAQQSIFPGSIFRNCKIEQCDFARSDFEGVRFEKCEIVATDFEDCDIRSTLFAECRIEDSGFKGAYFADNVVRGGVVQICTFDTATMTGNHFLNVKIESISNVGATMLHNDFISSSLQDIKLANCTALYSYFEECSFERFGINADSLGLTFGLGLRDLEQAALTFLGREEPGPLNADIVDQLIAEFEARRWMLHSAFARLNFGRVPPYAGWAMLFGRLCASIENSGVRLDDVDFVLHVAGRLSSIDQLPFFPIVQAHDLIIDISIDENATIETRALRQLRNGLVALLGEMQDKFVNRAGEIREVSGTTPAMIEFIFQARPDESFENYLRYIDAYTSTKPTGLSLLGGHAGSWHEIVQSVVSTALAIYALLYLIEGGLARLLMIRARFKQLVSREIPKRFLEKSRDPQHVLPADLLKVTRPLVEGLAKGTLRLPARESGVTTKNLREIAIKCIDE